MLSAIRVAAKARLPRSAPPATGAVGVAFMIGIGIVSSACGAEQDADAARLRTTINEKTAILNLKPRSADLPSVKAMRVRNLIKQGEYASAGQDVSEVLTSSHLENWRYYPFSDFMGILSDVSDPAYEMKLNGWVEQDKTNPIPWIVRAQFSYDMGWFRRGHNFATETPAGRMAAFSNYMAKGLADAEAAARLDENPYIYYLKLRFLRGFGISQELRSVFAESISKYPNYYPMYDLMLQTLQPRWGGTPAAMADFVNQYASHASEHSPLKLLYLGLYRYLLSSGSVLCNGWRLDNDQLAKCVASYMEQNTSPDLERQVQQSLQIYDNSDQHQFSLAVKDMLFEMLRTRGGDAHAGAILELAASAMHSNTQLKDENKSGHNNYIIDEAVGESWYQKRFYDNALTKYQEALREIEFSRFPSENEKGVAISLIYDRLAHVYTSLNQYVDLIVYEQAAIKMVGPTGNEHLICYGYYQLTQDAEGVRACTDALNGASNLPALYWRGMSYQRLGQLDDALKDLRAVADSDHRFRTSAAIAMSGIYDELKDFKSSLDVLEKYTFLYDEKTQSKENIAASYNNRCYALMELGELTKALDDCTKSLRYASLPDAYRKQQEIVKRLKARETPL